MVTRRIILIVLDGLGVGYLPDASDYGDVGANTLENLLRALQYPPLPNFEKLGLLHLVPSLRSSLTNAPLGCFGKMAEVSKGKDSTTGHWELMGIATRRPFPTYPRGFPPALIRPLERKIGRKVVGNKVASGTEILQELGEKHCQTGSPIVYTSVDSVFQIAAHQKIISVPHLYRICQTARKLLRGRHAMGRVIARPFVGGVGNFRRTAARKDFTLPPPSPTVLDRIQRHGGRTIGIGKIGDLFSSRGLSHCLHTESNADGIAKTLQAIQRQNSVKLIFTNLVDTDMLYGHRNDCTGYYRCLKEFDDALPKVIGAMKKSDILMIASDHGCDPTMPGTDHTREYVPLIVWGPEISGGVDLGTRTSFSDVGQTILDILGYPRTSRGTSFAPSL